MRTAGEHPTSLARLLWCGHGALYVLGCGCGIAPVLRRCCHGVVPLGIPCTTLVQPLYNPCTTLVQPLYNPCTTLVHPLYNPCTSLVHPLYIPCTSLVLARGLSAANRCLRRAPTRVWQHCLGRYSSYNRIPRDA